MDNDQLINEMQSIREKNNGNWMDLVRLAMKVAPEEARSILAKIVEHDKNVVAILEDLSHDNR